MFEKEAEEIVKRNVCEDCNRCQSHGYIGCDIYRYSKDSCLRGLREGYNKANEWHYVKDGDLPTHTRQVLVYLKSDDVDIDCYGKGLGWKNHLNEQIKAWKEIVPPKENE